MNVSQESPLKTPTETLVESLQQVAEGMKEQTASINRLAESNETLAAMIYQFVAGEDDDPDMPHATYLSGQPRG